jgi:hypothetical protein
MHVGALWSWGLQRHFSIIRPAPYQRSTALTAKLGIPHSRDALKTQVAKRASETDRESKRASERDRESEKARAADVNGHGERHGQTQAVHTEAGRHDRISAHFESVQTLSRRCSQSSMLSAIDTLPGGLQGEAGRHTTSHQPSQLSSLLRGCVQHAAQHYAEREGGREGGGGGRCKTPS